MQFSHYFNLFQSILAQGFQSDSTAASEEALGDRLTYRGVSCRRPAASAKDISFAANGTYRGGTWISQSQSWVPNAMVVLRDKSKVQPFPISRIYLVSYTDQAYVKSRNRVSLTLK